MTLLCALALAMTAGLLMTRVVKKVHLPNVTGYLVAGLLIGPSVLNLVPADLLDQVSVITTLALGFIAFSIGSEFRLSHIRAIGARAITITLFEALTAVLITNIVLYVFGAPLPMSLTLGAIAAATAPAATLMVVRQYRAKGPVTDTLLPVVAMDDAVCLMAYSLSIALARTIAEGTALTVNTVLLQPVGEILLSLVIGAALGFLLSLATRFFASRANRLCLMITAVTAGVALSELWGLSSLLTCMMIGALFCNLRSDSDRILEGMDRWTPPVFMLFFVISGAELELALLPTVGLFGVLYLLARSLGKYVGAWAGATLTKCHPNIRRYLGVTLLPQAGVAVGLAQLALSQLPSLGSQIRAIILCATLVYELIGPVLTKIVLGKADELGKRVSG